MSANQWSALFCRLRLSRSWRKSEPEWQKVTWVFISLRIMVLAEVVKSLVEKIIHFWNESRNEFGSMINENRHGKGELTLKCKTLIGGCCRQINGEKLQVLSVDYSEATTVASAASCPHVTMAEGTGFIEGRINIRFVLGCFAEY